jgi:hypothetical protein
MVSVRVPGMYGWGNPSSQLPGVLGSSPSHRSGLGTPFFVGKPRSYDNPLVNKDKALKTARYANNEGQCWACHDGLEIDASDNHILPA